MVEAILASAVLTAVEQLRDALAPQPTSAGATLVIGALSGLAALAAWLIASGLLTKAGRRDRALRASLRKYKTDRDGWSTIAEGSVDPGGPIFAVGVDARVRPNSHGMLDLRVRRSDREHPTFTRAMPHQGFVTLTLAHLGITGHGHIGADVPPIDLNYPYAAHVHLDLRERAAS